MSDRKIILLATSRPEELDVFEKTLAAEKDITVISAATDEALIEAAVRTVPALAVIDQEVNGVDALDIVRRLLQVNAFIYTAVLSDMNEEMFHEISEGLGILAALPTTSGADQARRLLERFRDMAAGAML